MYLPIFLLIISNIFMTFAWYGHLKFPNHALWVIVLISWGIALFEYCFAVPANRIGAQHYSLSELKTIQVVVTLLVFTVISILFFDEKVNINHLMGFILMSLGAWFVFKA